MTDLIGTPGGESGKVSSYYHDDGNGAFDEAGGAHLRGWDATDGKWYRVPVDHASGALLSTLTVGALEIGKVDQGAPGASAWKVDGTGGTFPVTGTFWQATQPVSISTLSLSAGTATIGSIANASFAVTATLAAETSKVIGTVNQGTSPWVTSRNWTLASGTDSVNVGNFPGTYPVSGTFWQTTQPVSAASLPLPAGAAVESAGNLQVLTEVLQQVLMEARVHTYLLGEGLNVRDDPALLRGDPALLN